jgi:hypothetical protein
MTSTPDADALASATTTDSSTMPITSSITAAPRMVAPSRERNAPISSSVCAEMLTLVAVRIVPMKMPSQYSGKPNATAVAAPPTSGSRTPPVADQKATFPTRRISTRSVSSPATNIRSRTPRSERSRISAARLAWTLPAGSFDRNTGQPSMSRTVGPSSRPTRISPKTDG